MDKFFDFIENVPLTPLLFLILILIYIFYNYYTICSVAKHMEYALEYHDLYKSDLFFMVKNDVKEYDFYKSFKIVYDSYKLYTYSGFVKRIGEAHSVSKYYRNFVPNKNMPDNQRWVFLTLESFLANKIGLSDDEKIIYKAVNEWLYEHKTNTK